MQAVALAVKLRWCVDTVCVDTSQFTTTLTVAPKMEAQLPYVRIVAFLFQSGREKYSDHSSFIQSMYSFIWVK